MEPLPLAVEDALLLELSEGDAVDDEVAVSLGVDDGDAVVLALSEALALPLAVVLADMELDAVTLGLTEGDALTDALREGVGLLVGLTEGVGTRLLYPLGCTAHKGVASATLADPPTQPMVASLPPNSVGSTATKSRLAGDAGSPDAMVTRRRSLPGTAPDCVS